MFDVDYMFALEPFELALGEWGVGMRVACCALRVACWVMWVGGGGGGWGGWGGGGVGGVCVIVCMRVSWSMEC